MSDLCQFNPVLGIPAAVLHHAGDCTRPVAFVFGTRPVWRLCEKCAADPFFRRCRRRIRVVQGVPAKPRPVTERSDLGAAKENARLKKEAYEERLKRLRAALPKDPDVPNAELSKRFQIAQQMVARIRRELGLPAAQASR